MLNLGRPTCTLSEVMLAAIRARTMDVILTRNRLGAGAFNRDEFCKWRLPPTCVTVSQCLGEEWERHKIMQARKFWQPRQKPVALLRLRSTGCLVSTGTTRLKMDARSLEVVKHKRMYVVVVEWSGQIFCDECSPGESLDRRDKRDPHPKNRAGREIGGDAVRNGRKDQTPIARS